MMLSRGTPVAPEMRVRNRVLCGSLITHTSALMSKALTGPCSNAMAVTARSSCTALAARAGAHPIIIAPTGGAMVPRPAPTLRLLIVKHSFWMFRLLLAA